MSPPPRRAIAFKIKQDDLDRIDALAEKHQLTRTAFIIQSCLGVLIDPASIQADLEDLRSRVKRLEQSLFE